MHHSDRGSQYTSHDYTQTLDDAGVLASVGTAGDAYDNALAESFVDTFEAELIADRVCAMSAPRLRWPSAILRASSTRSVRMWAANCQPRSAARTGR